MSDFQLWVPVLSLVNKNCSPLEELIHAHLHWLQSCGMQGLLVMGTTGEFPHFSVRERQQYLEATLRQNPGMDVMVNIGSSSLSDVLELQRHALSLQGVQSLLLMPPFYYPEAQVNGLEGMLRIILQEQPAHIPFYLYHYPKMGRISITPALLECFPRIQGLKDTSGDFARIAQLVQQFPERQVFVGTDTRILRSLELKSAGVISGIANVFPKLVYQVARHEDSSQEAILRTLRGILDGFPKIPALKAVLNHLNLAPQKTTCIPPFQELDEADCQALLSAIHHVSEGEYVRPS